MPTILTWKPGNKDFPRPRRSPKFNFYLFEGRGAQTETKRQETSRNLPLFQKSVAGADPVSHHRLSGPQNQTEPRAWALGLFSLGFFLIAVLPFFLRQDFWVLIWVRAQPSGIPLVLPALDQILFYRDPERSLFFSRG